MECTLSITTCLERKSEYNIFDDRINDFCNKGIYIHCFKTSAKLGINVNECMMYLIENVINRFDKFNKEGKKILYKERKSIVLQKSQFNDEDDEMGDCC